MWGWGGTMMMMMMMAVLNIHKGRVLGDRTHQLSRVWLQSSTAVQCVCLT